MAGEVARELASAAHFPALRLSQSFLGTNNPVLAFSAKLVEREFSQADFEVSRLNHPSFQVLNQTSATLEVPLYLGGSVRAATRAAEANVAALEQERQWTRKELVRSLYSLYHAYWALSDLEAFLGYEKEYLEGIIRSYDATTPENRNRYLSYNQALITMSGIDEGLASVGLQKANTVTALVYLTGAPVEQLAPPESDPLADYDWQATPTGRMDEQLDERPDVRATAYMRDAAAFEADRASAAFIPSLSGFGQYDINTEKWSHFAEDATVGVSLTWSLGVTTFRQVELARRNLVVANHVLNDKREATRSELLSLRADVARLSASLAQAEKRHALFAKNKQLMTLQYEQGSLELYDMLENFAHYLENYRELQKARAELRSALIRYADNFREVL